MIAFHNLNIIRNFSSRSDEGIDSVSSRTCDDDDDDDGDDGDENDNDVLIW